MKEYRDIYVFPTILLIGFMVTVVAANLVYLRITDNYCMNVPLDRMDKKRCGLQP